MSKSSVDRAWVRRKALIALLLVLLPNLVLNGLGLLTALVFTVLHLPARLLAGQPLAQALTYVMVQLLPMALLFGVAMLAANHTAAPALLHLAWNWAAMLKR